MVVYWKGRTSYKEGFWPFDDELVAVLQPKPSSGVIQCSFLPEGHGCAKYQEASKVRLGRGTKVLFSSVYCVVNHPM